MPGPAKLVRRCLAALGLSVAALPACSAAESLLEPPELGRYLRWGPLRVRPGIELTQLGYDDNIFLQGTDPVSDVTAGIAPKIDGLLLLGSRAFVTFDQRFEFLLYVNHGSQNVVNSRGSARATLPVGAWGVFVEGGLSDVYERPIDFEDVRTRHEEIHVGGGIVLEPGWRTQIEIARTEDEHRYTDSDIRGVGISRPESLDRDERGTRLRVSWVLRGRTDLTLEAREEAVDFVNSLVPKDSDSRVVLPGIRLRPGGNLSGTLRAGWAHVDAHEPALPDLDEPIAELRLALRPTTLLRLELEGERTAGFSFSTIDLYYVQTLFGVRAIRYFTPVVGAEIGARAGQVSFPSALTFGGRVDDLQHYEAGMRLRFAENSLGRRVEYSVRVGLYERESNRPGFDYSHVTFGFGAVVGY